MAELFRLWLYTKHDLTSEDAMAAMWKLLAVPLISPLGYGSTEDAESTFSAAEYASAAATYGDEGTLFVRGGNAAFQVMFSKASPQVATWNFYLDLKAMKGKTGEAWLQWFYTVCRTFPVLFGAGSSTEEYKAKHRVQVTFPDGGRTTKMLGVSMDDFRAFLPGVYWLTVFGAELVEHFGADTLSSLEGTTATQIDAGQIAIVLKTAVKPRDLEERLAVERGLAQSIGDQFFFDRLTPDAQRTPVPQLQAAIRS